MFKRDRQNIILQKKKKWFLQNKASTCGGWGVGRGGVVWTGVPPTQAMVTLRQCELL